MVFSTPATFARAAAIVFLIGAGFAWPVQEASAQKILLQENYDPNGTLRIEVESVFGGAASRGFLPVRVTLRNMKKAPRSWTLRFSFDGGWNQLAYSSVFRVSAESGTEPVHELLVPVPTAVGGGGSMYRNLRVEASSPGLAGANRNDSTYYSTDWPAIGISKKLAERNTSRLDAAVQGRSRSGGNETFGVSFEAGKLPSDWRGYTTLDALIITDQEWEDVSPGARLAIIEWVRLGGRLDLYSTGSAAAALSGLDLPGAIAGGGTEHLLSLGEVRAWKWNGQDLEPNKILTRYRKIENRGEQLSSDYQDKKTWGLYRSFDTKSFSPWLVILLLIAFGIIVGPINLFVWAKPGQRHRLFITTPIISVAASSLILLLILFNDGIGGNGLRIVLANLQSEPGEKRLYVNQEQISRTGVLLGAGFQIDDPVFLSPVMIPPSEWNRISLSGNTVASYTLSDRTYRGDWFQSRSEQGHFAQTVRPTRSRIELTLPSTDPGTPPKLFSSLEFTLDEFYYRDDQGNVWKGSGEGIAGGEEIPLKTVEPKDLEEWWGRQVSGLSDSMKDRAKKLWLRDGHFFAVSTDPNAGFVDTLGSIDWKRDKAIVFGTVTVSGIGSVPVSESEADGNAAQ